MTYIVTQTPIERFEEKFICEPNSGCWLWTAYCEKNGYGVFVIRHHQNVQAHRQSYEFYKGPIPEGLTIDHLCRVRNCVNPQHLEAVPMRVNVCRGTGPSAINSRKTHCPQGHEYDRVLGPNSKRPGQRICNQCDSRRHKERYWARRAA